MKYSAAKELAKKRVYETRIDHVISFDGVSYSVAMLPRYKGNITEVVKYKFVKPTKNASNENTKHTTTRKKKASKTAK